MKCKIENGEPRLKQEVLSNLNSVHGAKLTDIGLFVKDWAIALEVGTTSHGGKRDAVRAAEWVASVKAIAGGINVKLPDSQRRTDKEIAAAAANQINLSSTVPKGTVAIKVHEGWITLEGEVEWYYQKKYAENAVEHLAGVKGVLNQITIKPAPAPTETATALKTSFARNAHGVASHVQVKAPGNKLAHCGKALSHAE
jgi:osmotically-inducible protein OsmY